MFPCSIVSGIRVDVPVCISDRGYVQNGGKRPAEEREESERTSDFGKRNTHDLKKEEVGVDDKKEWEKKRKGKGFDQTKKRRLLEKEFERRTSERFCCQ